MNEVLAEPDFKTCFSIFLLLAEKEVVLGVVLELVEGRVEVVVVVVVVEAVVVPVVEAVVTGYLISK